MKVRLGKSDFAGGLLETYDNAALKAGFKVDDHSQYDCRHICVAENIQDGWIRYYSDSMKENNPSASDAEINTSVMTLLLMCGAKVEKRLADNEVQIEEGFIVNP